VVTGYERPLTIPVNFTGFWFIKKIEIGQWASIIGIGTCVPKGPTTLIDNDVIVSYHRSYNNPSCQILNQLLKPVPRARRNTGIDKTMLQK